MSRRGGELGEAAVLAALLRHDLVVLVPFGQSQPYDLVVHLADGSFVRVQVKTGWERDGCVLFNSCSTDHGHGRQDYRGRADVFGVYAPTLDRVFMVPVAAAPTRVMRLRLTATRNGQRAGVRDAADFGVEHWLEARRP
jgi:hypothetical protein